MNDWLLEALQTALLKDGATEMVTKAIVVYETMNEEGDKGLRAKSTDGMTPWDRLGFMSSMMSSEQAEDVVWTLERSDGE